MRNEDREVENSNWSLQREGSGPRLAVIDQVAGQEQSRDGDGREHHHDVGPDDGADEQAALGRRSRQG